ncbi:hypothetical protein MKW94_021600 [Papaver nudicaule]|uniref:Ribosomal protein S21 n=1 Tax=Papaver nudicaule TaxID=74823 RepID=A0AA41RPV1_PAPNU|nr:hypothetical protein [Papaver nudicaule]
MNSVAKNVCNIFRNLSSGGNNPNPLLSSLQQWRGIKVRVRGGNVEQALQIMQRKMTSTGMERLIKRQGQQTTHLKNSEKRVLARKTLDRRLKSQDLARKLNSILLKKISSGDGGGG